jgi:hypothetical protein
MTPKNRNIEVAPSFKTTIELATPQFAGLFPAVTFLQGE